MTAAPQADNRALIVSNSLADLAVRIRQEHDAVAGALKTSLAHAMMAGDLLLQAKAQVPHGQWLPWLCDRCQVSERMAQRYIRLARNRGLIETKCDTVSDLGVRGALSLIALERSSSDHMIATSVGLANHAAESAFDVQDNFNTDARLEAEHQLSRGLLAEAQAAIEGPWSAGLIEIFEDETQEILDRLITACQEYCAACEKYGDGPLSGRPSIAILFDIRDIANEWRRQAEAIVAREGGRAEAAQ